MGSTTAQGTVITINDGTNPVVFSGAVSFDGLDGEASEVDETTLASTAKEFKLGLIDNGNFNIAANYDPDDVGQAEAIAIQASGVKREMVITLPNAKTLTFDVLCKSAPVSGAVDALVTTPYGFRISGAVARG